MKSTNSVLAELAEEIEADFATRDTNDGSTYCAQCGAPQPKWHGGRKPKWKHDPSCVVETVRGKIGVCARPRPERATKQERKQETK